MEDIFGEIGKGFLRGIGYLVADIFFRIICFWVGWPLCKILSFGKYPKPQNNHHRENERTSDDVCCMVGFSVLFTSGLYFLGVFE